MMQVDVLSRRLQWVLPLVLIFAGIHYTENLQAGMDVGLADETSYMWSGLNLPHSGIPSAEKGPIYTIWYFLLSRFEQDPVSLYYLNQRILSILPPFLIALLLVRLNVNVLVAIGAGFFILISRAMIVAWPKPSHLALVILLLFLFLTTSVKPKEFKLGLMTVAAAIICYIRPEYFLAYLLLLASYFWSIYLRAKKQPLSAKYTAWMVCSCAALVIFGVMNTRVFLLAPRGFVAFAQHFAFNWVGWSGSDLNPWTDAPQIVRDNFGSARSFGSAFLANPSRFTQHLWSNAINFKRLPALIVFHANVMFPPGELNQKREAYALLFLSAGLLLYRLKKQGLQTTAGLLRGHKDLFLLTAPFILVGLLTCLLIFPRDHYLLIPGALIIVCILPVCFPNTWKPSFLWHMLTAVLIVLLVPRWSEQNMSAHDNLDTIQFIQALHIPKPVTVLEAEGGFACYLNQNYRSVFQYEKVGKFSTFLQQRGINMIVLSDALKNDSRFRTDQDWEHFLTDYQRRGFQKMQIPSTSRALYLQSDLLTAP